MQKEETISRQAVCKIIDDIRDCISVEGYWALLERLKKLPAVNPQPKTGHWRRELIRNEKGGCIGAKMICSECGNDNKHDEYMTYCPNCGAKMSES